MNQGFVRRIISNLYTLVDSKTHLDVLAAASGKLRYVRIDEKSDFNTQKTDRTKKENKTMSISPRVGDHVLYDMTDERAVIQEILPRKNALDRPDVANVDQVLLVFSATNPAFSFVLLDKFLIILGTRGIRPVIIVSKIDLMPEDDLKTLKKDLDYYVLTGYDIHYVNSKTQEGFDGLRGVFKDKMTVLAGQTGVGKSTLINALIPGLSLNTQEISKALGRGKHTTRHTELFRYAGGYVCDTPGFSKIDFDLLDPEEIKTYYPDFVGLQDGCRFGHSCLHHKEPGCAVINASSKGLIPTERLERYHQFLEETKNRKRVY